MTRGSVLVQSMITQARNVLPAGKTLVGLSVKEGQYPNALLPGYTVAAYLVGNDVKTSGDSGDSTGGSGSAGAGGTPPISDDLIINHIASNSNGGFGDGTETITVIADSADAGPLAVASAAGNVSLVLVPSKH
jgi:hypothetical protein